jgi:hypothetical protein
LSHGAAAVGAVRVMLGTAPMQVGGGEHTANALLEQFNFGLDPPPPERLPPPPPERRCPEECTTGTLTTFTWIYVLGELP